MLIDSYFDRQQRILNKRRDILRFMRDEIWSTAKVLSVVVGVTEISIYKTLHKLERDGYLKSHYIQEHRLKIWGVTPLGLIFSWDKEEQMKNRPYFEASKVKPLMMYHHIDLQKARLRASDAGWYDWVPGNYLPLNIKKRPDAIVNEYRTNNIIAIELERNVKTKKRYEAIFVSYLTAIKKNKYHSVHYVCPCPEFAIRLQRMFYLITSIPVAGQRVTITDKHRARIVVFALERWPPKVHEPNNEMG